jgi:hypothetical protein
MAAASPAAGPVLNAMTVDVEDYFHVQALAEAIRPEQWGDWPNPWHESPEPSAGEERHHEGHAGQKVN